MLSAQGSLRIASASRWLDPCTVIPVAASRLAAINPLKAYQENLKQAEKLAAYVKELAPTLDPRLPQDLAKAQVDTLLQIARLCKNEAEKSKPPWQFFDHNPGDSRYSRWEYGSGFGRWVYYDPPSKDEWLTWANMGATTVRYYSDAIGAHQRILQAAAPFAGQFEQQIVESRRLIMEMDNARDRVQKKVDHIKRFYRVPGSW